MEIVLPKVLSGEFKKATKTIEIATLEKKLMSFVNSRFYGEDIAEYAIHIICVHPKYDPFFKVGNPFYVKNKDVIVEGIAVTIYKRFDVKIKLNFEEFYKSDKENGLRMIASEIITTVRDLKYPAKIKDFDKEIFFQDLSLFFKNEGVILI